MNIVVNILDSIKTNFSSPLISASVIISVLIMVAIVSAYEFVVYKLVSHRTMYNKSFNICVAVLPFFIATIILCLQSNIVITLGTIGALAIIRFRTAIKDPVDMLYLLWAVHTGITCGCQLYEVSIFTSLVVTIALLILENVKFGRKPYVIVFHCENGKEEMVLLAISEVCKKYRVKSRNYTSKGMDLVVEVSTKDASLLSTKLSESPADKYSIIEYDSDDVI